MVDFYKKIYLTDKDRLKVCKEFTASNVSVKELKNVMLNKVKCMICAMNNLYNRLRKILKRIAKRDA